MREHTAPTAQPVPPMHPVRCLAGEYRTAQLISNMLPNQGYTAFCRSCKRPHLITWDSLPPDVLRSMMVEIGLVLATADNEPSGH